AGAGLCPARGERRRSRRCRKNLGRLLRRSYQHCRCQGGGSWGTRGSPTSTIELDLLRTVVPPALPGIYVWHALVTPLTAAGTVDENGAWEVRALVPWPSVLTLHARHAKAKGRYVLYGRLVLAGKPRGGATIRLLRATSATEGSSS